MGKSLIYLATPYSHPDKAVRLARFEAVNRFAAKLMAEGRHVYSPISHTHPIAEAGGLPLGWEYWDIYDRTMMSACSGMIVFCQPGWSESKGVTAEIEIATEMNLEIEFVWPESSIDLTPLLEQHGSYDFGAGFSVTKLASGWNLYFRGKHVDCWRSEFSGHAEDLNSFSTLTAAYAAFHQQLKQPWYRSLAR